jgi:4-diphosphocytidyl-2-C-methyl-D-erythritol kinase
MVVFPNIKINIGLSITSKRADGYHNIESVMIPIPWCESLEVLEHSGEAALEGVNAQQTEVGKVTFYSYGLPIPGKAEKNLCIRVFELLESWFNLPATDIHLLKALPIGAGLGAGSADAAFCLRALKDFYNLKISDFEAKELLSKIGSDCPFFWDNKPVFAFGKGDELRPIDLDLSNYWICLIHPNLAISTQEAYAGVNPKQPIIDLNLIAALPIETWKEVVKNDFEDSLFPKYPLLEEIKNKLYGMDAVYASMSGSGSTMYGIFDHEPRLPEEWLNYSTWIGKIT